MLHCRPTEEAPTDKEKAAELEEQVESLQQQVCMAPMITELVGTCVPEQLLPCQVLLASSRVAELRSSVPAAVLEELKGNLEQCRPPAVEQAAAALHDGAEGANAALSPAPAELQDKFAGATDKMPALRWGAGPLSVELSGEESRVSSALCATGPSWRRPWSVCSVLWPSWRPTQRLCRPTRSRGPPEAWPRRLRLQWRRRVQQGACLRPSWHMPSAPARSSPDGALQAACGPYPTPGSDCCGWDGGILLCGLLFARVVPSFDGRAW